MDNRVSTTAEIVAKLKKCTSVGSPPQKTVAVVNVQSSGAPPRGNSIIKHPPPASEYWYTKTQTRVRSLCYELKGGAWDDNLEYHLCCVLADYAKLCEVRTLEGMVGAVRHASVVLSMFPGSGRMKEVHVREKIIKMRALFFKFWTFVVNFQLPFDSNTGMVTRDEAYEALNRNETDLERHFFREGLPSFFHKHSFFIGSDAAFFTEELVYYCVEGDQMLFLMDGIYWGFGREVDCFRVLASVARNMDVSTVDGVLLCIREASKQLKSCEDQIRRRVRVRRSPLLRLCHLLHKTGREVDLETGKFPLVEADNLLPPHFLTEVRHYSAHGFPGFQHQRDFYIYSNAAFLPEEKYLYFSDDIDASRRYDVGGLLRRIPPHNQDDNIQELTIRHSVVLAQARSLGLM